MTSWSEHPSMCSLVETGEAWLSDVHLTSATTEDGVLEACMTMLMANRIVEPQLLGHLSDCQSSHYKVAYHAAKNSTSFMRCLRAARASQPKRRDHQRLSDKPIKDN